MALLRAFETPSWFTEWTAAKPELKRLLLCFEIRINHSSPSIRSVSVHEARTALEEVENVAAHYQTYDRDETKTQYAVRIDSGDCRRAGIEVRHNVAEGTSGIKFVDTRHFNLKGTQQQFIALVSDIIARVWEGEDRLRVFPKQLIHGQLAIFSCLAQHEIEPESLKRCLKPLAKNPTMHRKSADGKHIEIRGELAEGTRMIPVVGARPISAGYHQAWWQRTLDYLLRRAK